MPHSAPPASPAPSADSPPALGPLGRAYQEYSAAVAAGKTPEEIEAASKNIDRAWDERAIRQQRQFEKEVRALVDERLRELGLLPAGSTAVEGDAGVSVV